jgi:hypothetical protein
LSTRYYLYRHVRLDKNEPFYIGIGSGKRAWNNDRRSNWWKGIAKHGYDIDIMLDDLTWEQACNKEKEFIKLYGRTDLNKGILVNMTDGGDGATGKIVTEAERIKHSLANMGKNKNKPKPEGFGQLISFLTKGKLRGPRSKEHNINLAAARSIPILCYDLQGNLVKEYRSIVATEEDGFDASNVSANIKGRLKTCKKHIFKYK